MAGNDISSYHWTFVLFAFGPLVFPGHQDGVRAEPRDVSHEGRQQGVQRDLQEVPAGLPLSHIGGKYMCGGGLLPLCFRARLGTQSGAGNGLVLDTLGSRRTSSFS